MPARHCGDQHSTKMATATQPTVDELEKREEEAFKTGPLSVLTTSVKSNSTVCAAATSIRAHKPWLTSPARLGCLSPIGVDKRTQTCSCLSL